ncbi:hypothetical protein DWV46_05625 [Sellimonas intestinalis]|uniref:Uncharacterized protein n=1 Tax=Sellimonas intestinalis TaxID=1653434 RepID=A0A3E3K4G6_9FIRM|nr:hypothetical protein AXF09_13875 [Ruminococcus sp. DSM 100440]PWM94218.1 MAG: hypothetical protein DBY12_01315 [Ruminococcus sp.]RGD38094.1 hypothetical protein DW166_03300 [Sellimonas intestinalis]RGE51417.1 hypothetical protein DW871_03455 [Sellimonas intestinalis]RGE54800.1 hypothetical protein DWW28_04905 [Sellimonas intestinalis]
MYKTAHIQNRKFLACLWPEISGFLCYRKKGCLNCVRKPLQAVNALCNNGKDRTRKCCVLPDTITHQPEKT